VALGKHHLQDDQIVVGVAGQVGRRFSLILDGEKPHWSLE
jgi:hypothetical protein